MRGRPCRRNSALVSPGKGSCARCGKRSASLLKSRRNSKSVSVFKIYGLIPVMAGEELREGVLPGDQMAADLAAGVCEEGALATRAAGACLYVPNFPLLMSEGYVVLFRKEFAPPAPRLRGMFRFAVASYRRPIGQKG